MFDREKFRQLVLYIVQQSQDDVHLNWMKLARLLFFVDFKAYAILGHSITGDVYLARADGPVPQHFRDILREMRGAQQIKLVGPRGTKHYVLGPGARAS